MKTDLHLSNFTAKFDLKSRRGIDTSEFPEHLNILIWLV